MKTEDILKKIDELIEEAEKYPEWTATQALKCLKKEITGEQVLEFADEATLNSVLLPAT